MMSVRECTKLYNQMLKMHESKAEPNRVNCYRCDRCGSITKTIDVDDGVTPYCYICEYCGNPFSVSTMYIDVAPNQKPTQEWYRPTLKECLKWRKDPSMLNHILNGGLDVRPIKQESQNQVSIIINGVRYEPYEIGAKSYPFYCGCCDLNSTEFCLEPNCPLEHGFVFKKSDKKFEK